MHPNMRHQFVDGNHLGPEILLRGLLLGQFEGKEEAQGS